jgi:HlyD family secretion protein
MPKPSRRRGVVMTVIGVLVVGAIGYAMRPQPIPADLGTVGRGALQVTVDGEGRTRVRDVYVVSTPVAGRVLRIQAKVGDPVVGGETMIASVMPSAPTFLDQRSLAQAEAQVRAAEAARALGEAEVTKARAELDFARTDLDRAERLAQRGVMPERSREQAELEVKTRRAALATAEANLRVRQFELETARAALITPGAQVTVMSGSATCCVQTSAPVSGRVLRVIQESEVVVPAGTPLVELGDPADLEIVVDLLSTDAVRVAPGDAVIIDQWGGDRPLNGRVRRIEPYGFTKISALGIEEQRVNVIIDVDDPREWWQSLGHGYRVETHIVVWQGRDVVKLPMSALFRNGDAWAVFVVEQGRARRRTVTVGHITGLEAELTGGLAEGETVVLHPSDQITDGVRIESRRIG